MIGDKEKEIFLSHVRGKTLVGDDAVCTECGRTEWQVEGPSHVIGPGTIRVTVGSSPVDVNSIPLILLICTHCFHARMFAWAPILKEWQDQMEEQVTPSLGPPG